MSNEAASLPLTKRRHVAVVGGTQIGSRNAAFCKALGRELAKEDRLVIVTGGFKCFTEEPEIPSSDWSTSEGAIEYLDEIGADSEIRVQTILPGEDSSRIARFHHGNTIIFQRCSLQSRRFRMINAADAVVTVQGGKGTREVINLALALEKPVLPLAFTGGPLRERGKKINPL